MILVTGASGMVGRALTLRYAAAGVKLRLQLRSTLYEEFFRPYNADVWKVDFSKVDRECIELLVGGCHTVIHCAGVVHQPDAPDSLYDTVNVHATKALIEAAAKAGVQSFVLCSTSAVYGNGPFSNIDENTALSPATPYARSKVDCESILQGCQSIPRRIIVRPSLVFGEGDRGNMLALIKQIKKGLYVNIGGNDASKSVIHARDLAIAIENCLELPPGLHVFNVANPDAVSVIDLANTIATCLGRARPLVVPLPLLKGAAVVAQWILGNRAPLTLEKLEKLRTSTTLSVEKLVATTGYSPEFTLSQALQNEIDSAFGKQPELSRP